MILTISSGVPGCYIKDKWMVYILDIGAYLTWKLWGYLCFPNPSCNSQKKKFLKQHTHRKTFLTVPDQEMDHFSKCNYGSSLSSILYPGSQVISQIWYLPCHISALNSHWLLNIGRGLHRLCHTCLALQPHLSSQPLSKSPDQLYWMLVSYPSTFISWLMPLNALHVFPTHSLKCDCTPLRFTHSRQSIFPRAKPWLGLTDAVASFIWMS